MLTPLTNYYVNLTRRPIGTVAFNMRPTRGPWGGSSTFVAQLAAYLQRRGYRVVFSLDKQVDLVLLIDPRRDAANRVFGIEEIARLRDRKPQLRVLHRINECDQRKGTEFMDRLLAEGNAIADYTVFISEWLRDYHAARWFDSNRPHSVVYNGADPRFFHPIGSASWDGAGPLRIVTHHWSDNPLKGFAEYEALDTAITCGEVRGIELVIVGRWPASIDWHAATTVNPLHGFRLAQVLKGCHAYITASRWEPCGMHHVEGVQCGLPMLYHRDGGGIVEAGRRYGIEFTGDLVERVEDMKTRYRELRENVLASPPSGDRMTLAFADIIQRMIAEASK